VIATWSGLLVALGPHFKKIASPATAFRLFGLAVRFDIGNPTLPLI
jgi:hypothetical protein